jgi:hypothetical protein
MIFSSTLVASMASRKQFIEQIAEPGLEHIDLGVGTGTLSGQSSLTVHLAGLLRIGRPERRLDRKPL